jgi:hypothetical protein
MADIDNRVSRLEFRADAQDETIKTLHETQAAFGSSLNAIKETLTQIKYALYGGGVVFVLNAIGLKETVLKVLFH